MSVDLITLSLLFKIIVLKFNMIRKYFINKHSLLRNLFKFLNIFFLYNFH